MPLPLKHYYGDQVRRLFVSGAVIMAGTLAFFAHRINEPLILSVIVILMLGIAAGLTSPKRPLTVVLDILISIAAVVIFEQYAITTYLSEGLSLFLLFTQTLAVVFVSALYFSTKTLRGMRKTE